MIFHTEMGLNVDIDFFFAIAYPPGEQNPVELID